MSGNEQVCSALVRRETQEEKVQLLQRRFCRLCGALEPSQAVKQLAYKELVGKVCDLRGEWRAEWRKRENKDLEDSLNREFWRRNSTFSRIVFPIGVEKGRTPNGEKKSQLEKRRGLNGVFQVSRI